MRFKRLVALGAVVLSGCSTLTQIQPFKDYSSTPPSWQWTALEYAQLGAANSAIGIDWYIEGSMSKSQTCHLNNPITGSHPSQGTNAIYFISLYGIVDVGAIALPQGWRDAWLAGWTGMESFIDTNNGQLRSDCLK